MVTDTIQAIRVADSLMPIAATVMPVTATVAPVIDIVMPETVHGQRLAAESPDHTVPRRPTSHLRVRPTSVPDSKRKRRMAETQIELGSTLTALGIANLERDRTLAELEHARVEVQSLR
jgi:hypothetical protein